MRITYIGCPFKTSYGAYLDSLRAAVEKRTGEPIQWVASNCGCGDPIERNKIFQTPQCKYFEMRHVVDYQSRSPFKRWLRTRVRDYSYGFRAKRYQQLSQDAQLIHLQQILNAYGSNVVFHWLQMPSRAAKVVTIHELDGFQTQFPRKNLLYNKADAVIVHCQEMKDKLISLGVQKEKVNVVLHGVDLLPQSAEQSRDGILFYGGHKLMTGKGMETLFEAMTLLKRRLGGEVPRLMIHGHYGTKTPETAVELAQRYGLSENIVWLNQLSEEDGAKLYLTASVLALPYTGSFAGLPVGLAAARGTPIVATRKAGIPDHLGENALWVEPGNAQQLAERLATILNDEALRSAIAEKLQRHAAEYLSWDVVGSRTLEVYAAALQSKRAAQAA